MFICISELHSMYELAPVFTFLSCTHLYAHVYLHFYVYLHIMCVYIAFALTGISVFPTSTHTGVLRTCDDLFVRTEMLYLYHLYLCL